VANKVNCDPEIRSSATRTIVGIAIALPMRRRRNRLVVEAGRHGVVLLDSTTPARSSSPSENG